MGMTCPMQGCHSTGWCKHKTMMLVMVIIIIAAAIAYLSR